MNTLKRSIKYLIILVGILIMFPTMLYLVLQIPDVQTGIVKRITAHLSEKLQSTISLGRIEYKFFNRLSINDILIKDKNNDTLLAAKRITAGIRSIDIKNHEFGLGRVTVVSPVISLITDSSGQMNLKWYLDQLKNKADTSKKAAVSVSVNQVDISNGRFLLVSHEKKAAGKKKPKGVDFNNLEVMMINGIVENINIKDDTTALDIYNLAFREKSGFVVKRMSSTLKISGQSILLSPVFLQCDSSTINLTKAGIFAATPGSYQDFIKNVKLDIRLDKSILHSSDLAYFVPLPEMVDESAVLSGMFMGTISELRGRDVRISYGTATELDCDFDVSGLPEIENAFIYIGVNELKTKAADIANVSIPGKKKIVLPASVYRLGNVIFKGSFTGFITDFVTYGEFRTGLGAISTDISLRPEEKNSYRVRGLLSGTDIDLGALTESEIPGLLTFRTDVDGLATSLKQFAGSLTGKVDSIGINNYTYRNIDLNGRFTEKTWDGSINMQDSNIRLDLLGMLNFSDTIPEFDFTLNVANANLHKLNIDKKDTVSYLTMLLTSNFKGNSIDNLDGEIKLLNSEIKKGDKTLELYDFSVRTYAENNIPVLSLHTDFVDALIKGRYNFSGLSQLVSSKLAASMPSLFTSTAPAVSPGIVNDFTFDVNFRNTDKINDFFKTGIRLAEKSSIKGFVHADSVIRVEGNAPSVSVRNIVFKDLDFDANSSGPGINSVISTSSVNLPGNTILKDFSTSVNTGPDKFELSVDWDNKEKILNRGRIVARGIIGESIRGKGKPVLKIDIDSSHVYAANNLWKITRSSIEVDSSTIKADRLHIGNNGRYYDVFGTVSENPSDTLHLKFSGIDISPLGYLMKKPAGQDSVLALNPRGQLNGNISMADVYRNALIQGNVTINNFSILGSSFGNVTVSSFYDYTRRVVDLKAGNNLAGKKLFSAAGYYDPVYKKINLDILADHLPVDALNPLLKIFASNISGTTSGKVKLSGPGSNLVLTGALMAEDVNMKITYLQTLYRVNDSIRFDNVGFRFRNVRITDPEGKLATLNGTVSHTNFRDYGADLTINMGTDFLVLNTLPRDNPMFYGKVHASGVTKIKAGPNLLSFEISAKTGRDTKFSIPLTNALSVTDYPFVSFIDKSDPDRPGEDETKQVQAPKQLGIDLSIDLNVTSDAVAEIIFDSKVGDKITGSGSGMLNITMNPKGDFRITGDYTIEDGKYLFTLGNIMNKKFDVERGGIITFAGNLDDAEIDLKATYKNISTSLYPILLDENRKERIAVEPQLLLTGNLFNPQVKFEINLPYSDEDIKTYLRNAISSDEEMSRQFLYLLVTNNFYSEQSAYTAGSGTSGTTAVAATTFEMLSNQLSNWISQINDNFNLGLSYKPGTGDKVFNPDELGVAFETQVLNDQLIINGNFDLKTNSESTDKITGDFDAELKLTEKLRLKVFNRFNDTYTGKGPYTQGIGIMFRQDFARVRDLFSRKEKSAMKKEEEPKVTISQ